MLLGKRPRLPIKRTTSMTGIRGDIPDVEFEEPSSDHNNAHDLPHHHQTMTVPHNTTTTINYSALVSPRNLRNQSAREFSPPPTDHFLRMCGLCKRRLVAGRDIYMYRGDTAFCSSECREKQIKEDERREYGGKKKEERKTAAVASTTVGGRGSRKKEPEGGGR